MKVSNIEEFEIYLEEHFDIYAEDSEKIGDYWVLAMPDSGEGMEAFLERIGFELSYKPEIWISQAVEGVEIPDETIYRIKKTELIDK